MIPDLQSCLLCEDVRQEQNGKMMLIGICDTIRIPPVEAKIPTKLCLVTRWCMGEGSFSYHSRIVRPDGKTTLLEGKNAPVKLKNTAEFQNIVEVFMNLPLQEDGTYWIEIFLEKEMRLRFPFRVIREKLPPAPPEWTFKDPFLNL